MSDQYQSRLVARLEEVGIPGTQRELSSVDSAGHVFYLQHGSVDLFFAQHAGRGDEGAHNFLFSVGAGSLFSLPVISDDYFGLVAVIGPSARYLKIPRAQFLAEVRASSSDEATAPIDNFVDAMLAGLPEKAPSSCRMLPGGSRFTTNAERMNLAPEPGVRWVEAIAGECRYFGSIPVDAGPVRVWSSDVWISAEPQCEIVASTTAQIHMRGLCAEMLDGIDAMLSLLSLEALRRKRLEDSAELARLQAKSENNGKIMSDALLEFAGIFDLDRHGLISPNGSDPLFAACRIIGNYQGIEFKKPNSPGKTTVRKIAQASRVRSRIVALTGEWWKSDNGPLLGFSQSDKGPVALIPVKEGGYEAIDPVSGNSTVVSASFADTGMLFGLMFYAALPSKKLALSDILRFASKGAGREIGVVAAIALATTTLSLVIPVASGYLFDSVFPAADRRQMVEIIVILFAVCLATLLLEATRSLAMLRIEGRASSNLQAAVWDRVLSLPAPFFRDYTAGDLATRINGINQIREILSGLTISTLVSGIFSLLTVFFLFTYSLKLALIAIGLASVAVAFNAFVGYFAVRATRETARLNGKVSGLVFEYLSGITKLRITGAERQAFANWATKFASQKRAALRTGALNNVAAIFGVTYPVISTAVIFLSITLLSSNEGSILSTGDFIAFSAAFTLFLGGALSLVRVGLDFVSVISIFDRVRPILEAIPESDEDKVSPGSLKGDIELSNVSFSYSPDSPPVLQDVSIHAKPGEFVALVGSSGSGKSTLLRLMLGFERPAQGYIYYDGHDLSELDIREVRQQIGVVLQNGKLMSGDVHSNITGSTTVSIDQVWEAARASGLDADIEAMPMGIHTLVSDGGGTLSGGQRQRLLIARAIVNKPRLVFFDEATSALDNRVQAIVSASLDQLKATRIVIAHRLSTIINADRIYVLDKGKVVQSGTYEQLMTQDGLFVELAKRQLA
ncbi:NHLP bacteriocin export ABC transporter permease/ATPase subunit [Massilia pinisoli]|uniref:NHLP bacteriocin export ABC transporter permease/ATPase subunit n=1 Tax=Massilia pinisoli TaxID=1772194 RepID=A0ABT1ZUH8_9BURK|nr:NHLP bacteriocin export ABC transporter permease/ATPase subunit [Massilia pinisoli]MCS0583568.1 NHLP bacteriocin export ABC transporter permease/ATPase subunit [Massilia pinisoli]